VNRAPDSHSVIVRLAEDVRWNYRTVSKTRRVRGAIWRAAWLCSQSADLPCKARSTPATMSKQRSTLLPKTATISNEFCIEISSFRQSRTLLRNCCPKRNIVEATGNKVACCFDNVASTLLLVWTGLKPTFRTQAASQITAYVGKLSDSRTDWLSVCLSTSRPTELMTASSMHVDPSRITHSRLSIISSCTSTFIHLYSP